MGYSTENNGQIRNFWPDDTDKEFYILESESLNEIMEKILDRWPDVSMSEIEISAEYIHTHCLGYDRYDSMDYTKFLKISRK